MILDSNFLIYLERETAKRKIGPATSFLLAHQERKLFTTPTICGEIASGDLMQNRERWREFTAQFERLRITEEVDWPYGCIYRSLKNRDEMIGQNDLWIAATALAHDMTVVTRNVSEFARVPGLRIQNF